jgi:asparagine synthase (glutamine-hydrolysing)
LFWGYPQLRQAAAESRLKESARGRGPLAAMLSYLSFARPEGFGRRELREWARGLGGLRAGLRRYRSHRDTPPGRLAFYDMSPDFRAASDEMQAHYTPDFIERLAGHDAAELFTLTLPWTDLEVTLTRLVCETYLRENGITQGDRLGMASSVEMRLPLVDYRLVETVIGLRKSRSDGRLPPKTWLREAVKDLLPADVLARPKQGFAPPTGAWHESLFAAYGDSLRDGYLVQTGVLSRVGGAELAHGSFPTSATSPLSFKALVLESWCRRMCGLNGGS